MKKLLNRILKLSQNLSEHHGETEQHTEQHVVEQSKNQKHDLINQLYAGLKDNFIPQQLIPAIIKNNLINQIPPDLWQAMDNKFFGKFGSFSEKINYFELCKAANRYNTNDLLEKIINNLYHDDVEKFFEWGKNHIDLKQYINFLIPKIKEQQLNAGLRSFVRFKEYFNDPETIIEFFIQKAVLFTGGGTDGLSSNTFKIIENNFPSIDFNSLINYIIDTFHQGSGKPYDQTPHNIGEILAYGADYNYIDISQTIIKLINLRAFEIIESWFTIAARLGRSLPYDKIGNILIDNGIPIYDFLSATEKFIDDETFKEYQYKLQLLKNEPELYKMIANGFRWQQRLDLDSLQKYIIENKSYNLIVALTNIIANNPKNFNLIAFQEIIENSKNYNAIIKFYELRDKFKINFASIKKRYNEAFSKAASKDPNIINDLKKKINDNLEKSRLGPDDIEKYKNFFQEMIDKKDWFLLTEHYMDKLFYTNDLISIYLDAKNKNLSNLYHETLKSGTAALERLYYTKLDLMGNYESFSKIAYTTPDFFSKITQKSNNFDQYVIFIERTETACFINHNIDVDNNILTAAILNSKFNIKDSTNQEFLEVLNYLEKYDINQVESQIQNLSTTFAENTPTNIDDFKNQYNIYLSLKEKFYNEQLLSFSKNNQDYYALKKLHANINILINFDTIKMYFSKAKPKNNKFKEFNVDMNNGFKFETLKFLDPAAFSVGAATDCCQRVGGAGEEAAIDSFINPLAGVIVLKYNDRLIAQSYFHYVPKDNGLILDNVESNSSELTNINLNNLQLSKLYADYAEALKRKIPNLAYVRCGKEYNKIDNNLFEKNTLDEDPRYFAVDDPYSDFDEDDHIDLLAPNEKLKQVVVTTKTAKQISTSFKKLSTSQIRMYALQRHYATLSAI